MYRQRAMEGQRKMKLGLVIGNCCSPTKNRDFPTGSGVKNPPANAGDPGLIPGSRRSPKEGNGNPLQYSCLGNPMGREA